MLRIYETPYITNNKVSRQQKMSVRRHSEAVSEASENARGKGTVQRAENSCQSAATDTSHRVSAQNQQKQQRQQTTYIPNTGDYGD